MSEDERICVASLGGAYGVRGEVRLKSYTANPTAVADYGPLETQDGAQQFQLTLIRPLKGGFAARLSGVGSKEEADALKGAQLYAPRTALPELPDDEFYHADLIGLAVHDTGGAKLGEVHAVHDHGAGDLLEIFGPGWKTTILLPFTRAAVPTIDIKAGRIVIDPPEGVFPDDE